MARIAREVIERAGLDARTVTGKLAAAAASELAAFYRHTVLSHHVAGLVAGDGLREVIVDIRAEDRVHFDELVTRIYELDGRLPDDVRGLMGAAGCPPDRLPAGLGGTAEEPRPGATGDPAVDLPAVLLETERRAIRAYADIRDLTAGKDPRTHDLAVAILNDKREHVAWLRELLGEDAGPRFHRGFRGRAPYVRRLGETS